MNTIHQSSPYSCYSYFYEQKLWYLSLLNLSKAPFFYQPVVRELSSITAQPTWRTDTLRLLAHVDWRHHLAPIVSYLTLEANDDKVNSAIWSAICRGSWVSPQLIVCLHLRGYDFQAHLPAFMCSGVEQASGTPFELHIAMGPGDASSRVGKTLNALSGLGFTNWEPIPLSTIDILREQDHDGADRIAKGWCERVSSRLQLSY